MSKTENIDEFISQYPESTRVLLQKIRQIIHETCPDCQEKISYGIPTFTLNGKNLVHFSAYEHHIGFYPGSAPIVQFQDELTEYKTSKGTVQFPIDKPLPFDLIIKMTKAAMERNLERKKKW